ncbi:MAG: hydrogenase expression/formation protein HypE [Novosphingobium sp.]|nr:hydrogenase expression/formation protein HypE [Novosphingobium sp.]
MSENSPFSLSCPVPGMGGERIELAHGGGGLLTQRLIDGIFRPAFAQSADDLTHDGAVLDIGGARLAFTTDSYVVQPLFFPGGDIGTLAVNGTVNDLAMCGARPIALSAGFVIEEGFALDDLERIARSMRDAAQAAGVRLVAGDTKVVQRGKGDGLYIASSGVGAVVARDPIAPRSVCPGDAIVLSGDIGRHGMAVMAVREGLGFEPPIASDCAPLAEAVLHLLEEGVEVHCLRDLTRGGLATALIEIARTASLAMRLEQSTIPVSEPVRGACEILGLDPLYVANEGRFVALVPARSAERTLAILRGYHESAAIIGTVEAANDRGGVVLQTLGSAYALDLLTCEQLPRIC